MVVSAGCSSLGGDDHDGFSSDEWTAIEAMTPLKGPMITNPVNLRADDMGVAKLGQKLFFDFGYAEPLTADNVAGKKGDVGKVACVSCHDPEAYFVDGRIDPMTGQRFTQSPGRGAANPSGRQAPMMLNEGWYEWAGWTGRFDSLVLHGSGVMGSAGSRLYVAHYVYSKYKDEYNLLFPMNTMDTFMEDLTRFPMTGQPKANDTAPNGPWETMTDADKRFMNQFTYNMARLWETYPRQVTSHGSDFENYMKGNPAALSPEAKRGLKVFVGKAACNDCHTGPILSDSKPHNVGVPTAPGVTTQDLGRYADIMNNTTRNNIFNGGGEYSDDQAAGLKKLEGLPTPDKVDESMKGQFRTPSILNCEKTFPYFHTGQFKTLEDVVDHYDKGGMDVAGMFAGTLDPKIKPLMLTGAEKTDLVAFLKSLTGKLDDSWARPIQ
jgi:cytochrome c peroxidase